MVLTKSLLTPSCANDGGIQSTGTLCSRSGMKRFLYGLRSAATSRHRCVLSAEGCV